MAKIAWYQEKIGAYDQQVWEKSLEQADLNGLNNKPKKVCYIKPDLIDVDLVKGSTFSKAKPESPWTALARKGLVRVLLFPFFFQWWIQVTSRSIFFGILILYFMQMAAVLLYSEVPGASASDVLGPMCLMLLLGTVHCQIVSTESSRGSSGSPSSSSSASPARRKRPRKSRGLKKTEENSSRNRNPEQKGSRQLHSNKEEGGASIKAKPGEQDRLRPGIGSRPTSDTDDAVWEELLQGPDSASTGSSGSDNSRGCSDGLALPSMNTLSSDDDGRPQETSRNQLSWLQACHPSRDRVSAIIWEQGECKKADMSVLEISGIILTRVKLVEQGVGYLMLSGLITTILALLPLGFRMAQQLDVSSLGSMSLTELGLVAAGSSDAKTYVFFFITTVQRICLTGLLFFMMCVAERTYKQRLLFAKYFSHITSARKAKKSEIPHFRLKKVQNIKMWLSLRSFLRRRGPQRSVDVIVSTVFLLALSVSVIICAQLLHSHKTFLDSLMNWELMVWASSLLFFLLRLSTLGSETDCKYSNSSVLLTEQINVYRKMEKKPHKKDELSVVNNVLKLATKLMKELDTPFRLLGLTVNPLIYNFTRVVILSAVSAVVSDLLGFNIRLLKIKP
ncbi:putative homeodomain transcription factor 1 isoform X2 [Takifugu flavidus]|uniref:putative homeodomain transcription factor 1 isoform X2 n=1 Tax=Takifugu flavidus TaxID=433684 RepID=UPI0025440907|nr:putative homeodomain transcription factor 1 isoform X2 [Takifugu flavidus]